MDWDRRPAVDLSGLRIAWCLTPSGTPVHPDIVATIEPARDLLQAAGGRVEDADPAIGEMTAAQQTFRDWSARLELGPIGRERRDELGLELQRTLKRADRLTQDDPSRLNPARPNHPFEDRMVDPLGPRHGSARLRSVLCE